MLCSCAATDWGTLAMQYAYEKLMEALGALVSEGPLPKRLEYAFNPLARLQDATSTKTSASDGPRSGAPATAYET
jgi:hypothetical protein